MSIMRIFLIWACSFSACAMPDGKGVNFPHLQNILKSENFYKENLQFVRGVGVTHIRLPISEHCLSNDLEKQCNLVKLAEWVSLIIDHNMSVSVDFHPDKRFYKDLCEIGSENCLLGAWRKIAPALLSFSKKNVYFEILNEPDLDFITWRNWVGRQISELRKLERDRVIVVGFPKYQTIDETIAYRPWPDENLIYAVHFYDPMAFTHQGAFWDKGAYYADLKNVPFPFLGNGADLNIKAFADLYVKGSQGWIDRQFAKFHEWAARYKVKVILNEFGVLRFYAPSEDRARWMQMVREAAERHNIPWVIWSFDDGFGVFEKRDELQCNPQILNSLGLRGEVCLKN